MSYSLISRFMLVAFGALTAGCQSASQPSSAPAAVDSQATVYLAPQESVSRAIPESGTRYITSLELPSAQAGTDPALERLESALKVLSSVPVR